MLTKSSHKLIDLFPKIKILLTFPVSSQIYNLAKTNLQIRRIWNENIECLQQSTLQQIQDDPEMYVSLRRKEEQLISFARDYLKIKPPTFTDEYKNEYIDPELKSQQQKVKERQQKSNNQQGKEFEDKFDYDGYYQQTQIQRKKNDMLNSVAQEVIRLNQPQMLTDEEKEEQRMALQLFKVDPASFDDELVHDLQHSNTAVKKEEVSSRQDICNLNLKSDANKKRTKMIFKKQNRNPPDLL